MSNETPQAPETPPNIQMTPVEFSPVSTDDAIGSVGARTPIREIQFPLAVPVTIMLFTMIFSTVRDIAGFNRRLADIDRQEAPYLEKLKTVPKQSEFIDSVRASLSKLAVTDPYAARIMKQYFPPEPKPDDQSKSTAPAK